MAVKLVTYDLNREVVRPNITKKLKEAWPTWAMLSESCYAIETDMSHDDVLDTLSPLIDGDDAIYVFDLKKPYAGAGPQSVIDWLEEQLTY